MEAPNYADYFVGDPTKITVLPPAQSNVTADNPFIKHLVKLASTELSRNEHQHLLHNAIFYPVIQQFALVLRPWLVLLTTIFLLLLIVGVVQLIMLWYGRTERSPVLRSKEEICELDAI